jgi:hypothetical protein
MIFVHPDDSLAMAQQLWLNSYGSTVMAQQLWLNSYGSTVNDRLS